MRSAVATAVALLVIVIMTTVAHAAPTLSETLIARADEAYPERVAYCNEIVANATRYIIDQLSVAAANGLDRYVSYFPAEAARCGRDRDQLALITATLCNEENDLFVVCDPSKTETIKDAVYFKMLVEPKRNTGAACACVAAPLDLPRPPSKAAAATRPGRDAPVATE